MITSEATATTPSGRREINATIHARFEPYIPLLVWTLVILTFLLIAGKIAGYGFLPMDDALRHAAKTVSGKPWSEILVMRSDFGIDPHPGWHAVLGWFHRGFGLNTENLVVLTVVGMLLLVNYVVLPGCAGPNAGWEPCSSAPCACHGLSIE